MWRTGSGSRLRGRVRRSLTVAATTAVLAVTAASVAVPAGATTHVPTCTALGRFSGSRVWVNTATDHQLVHGIDELICAAADYSTIDVKSWFLVDDDPMTNGMVARLHLMQRYHHVHVNVLVGYNPRHAYSTVQRTFYFAHPAICRYACQDRASGAVSHSKWITVSRLRSNGATAVLSTSTNWSKSQLALSQSGLVTVGDRSLYNAFVAKWSTLRACATHTCRPPRTAAWLGSGAVRVMFFPVATGDAVAAELARATCRSGGSIRVSSLYLSRPAVVGQLEQARARGCAVRVLLGQLPTPAATKALTPHLGRIHDKMLLISTPHVTEVIAGSANFTTTGLRSNDEQLVRVSTPQIVSMYRWFFDYVWTRTPVARPAALTPAAIGPQAPSASVRTAPSVPAVVEN